MATALIVTYLLLSFEGAWHVYRHPSSARDRVQAKFWFLSAAMIESWLPKNANSGANGQVGLVAESRYIEAGVAKTVRQHYRVAYRWTDGGLFRGKSVRLTGLRRG